MSRSLLTLLILLSSAWCSFGLGCGSNSHNRQVFCIEDDAKKGYLLGSIISQKQMRSRFGADWEKATFEFLGTNGVIQRYFHLDTKKGRLSLARDIDRDKLCAEAEACCLGSDRCHVNLKAVISMPEMGPTIETIRITIIDKNDHAPRFPNTREVLHINENARRGFELPLPLAEDPDALQYSVRDYFVAEGGPPSEFILDKRRAPPSPIGSGNAIRPQIHLRPFSQVVLKLDRNLDRERKSNYTFVLVAVDGGNPPFSGTTTIVIQVDDHNDNGPKFLKAAYEATVDEGRTVHEPLVTVRAIDPDVGENAVTRYDFAPTVDAEIKKLFEVMADSGKVFLRQQLDYEQASMYKFPVVAVDQAGHSATATASVTIRVRDRNDERPQISIGFVAGSSSSNSDAKKGASKKIARIKENGDKGRQFVAIIQVSDRDRGENGRVNCSLANFRQNFLLEQSPQRQSRNNLYMIYTSRKLDREEQARMDLQIRCQDRGRPVAKTSSITLPVMLLDENDNKPELKLQAMSSNGVEVRENQPIGTRVVLVKGTDPDQGKNGRITYSMAKSDSITRSLFKIDSRTGWVTTRTEIDREQMEQPLDQLPLIVTASDHGKPPHTSTVSVNIHIVDVNDNAPVFLEDPMRFQLEENLPSNHRVGEIQLLDKDSSSRITVRLDYSRNGQTLPFRIYKEGGKFYMNTTSSLDRERKPEYRFYITADDHGDSRSHRTSGQVIVTVKDVNDNVPKIIFPKLNNKSIHLSWREPKGHNVVSINARDLDKPEGSEGGNNCFFELTEDTTDILEIDGGTGTIRVHRTITERDIGSHKVGVIVRDNGQPSKHSTVTFTLVVDTSKPHRQNNDVVLPPQTRHNITWRSDITLMVVLGLIILLLVGIVVLIVYVRHWRQGFLFLPDLLSPCHRSSQQQKRRRQQDPELVKPTDPGGDKYLPDATLTRVPKDLTMRCGELKDSNKANSDSCSFSGLYSGTPTRQPPGVTTPFLPRDNSKYESLDPQRQAFLQQQQQRGTLLHQQMGTVQRGRSSLPDNKTMGPDLTKRDYDSLFRGPGDQYHVYQTISPGEAFIDDSCDVMHMPPGSKKHSTLRRQTSSGPAEHRPVHYNSEGDLTAGPPMEDNVGPRNSSVKFVFPPKTEQVYTKTYPVMQTSFV